MPVYLVPVDERYNAVAMDRAILFFGRHPDCDVVITTSRRVSRKHCCVAQIDDYFIVRDLGSTNGVRINGKAGTREARLDPGDRLTVGDIEFRIEAGPKRNIPKGKLLMAPLPGDAPTSGRRPPSQPKPTPKKVSRPEPKVAEISAADQAPMESMELLLDEMDLLEESSDQIEAFAEPVDGPLSADVIELDEDDLLE